LFEHGFEDKRGEEDVVINNPSTAKKKEMSVSLWKASQLLAITITLHTSY